ncbi:MAG: ABC transporter permease [Hespellia sp.]|nr:ABC transporter permease [Hespellia sp.]
MTKKKSDYIGPKVLNTLLPVGLAFLIGGIIILCIGENPLEAYRIMLGKSLFTAKGFLNTLHYASPLLLTGLAIAITFKANLFNMGVEGQLLVGGFFAGIAGASLDLTSPVMQKVVCMLVGIGCGVLFALIPALLRAFFHVDEMVVTLMLNYAMIKVLEYLSSGPFREAGSGYVCTPVIHESAMFQRLGIGNSRLTMFFFLAFAILLIMTFIFKKTKLGMEITAIGKNPDFAEATGMRVRRKIIILMCISGALAGLAGAGHMMSEKFKYTLGFSGTTGLGWDGMLIALLGRHNPIGVLLAAIFYSALKTGADNINMYTSVPKEIVGVLQGLIILFLAVQFLDERFGLRERFARRMSRKEEA